MNYELAKQLKEAGFPQGRIDEGHCNQCDCHLGDAHIPTLSELIEACPKELPEGKEGWGKHPFDLSWFCNEWRAGYLLIDDAYFLKEFGTTPEEAVAKLWLALKQYE